MQSEDVFRRPEEGTPAANPPTTSSNGAAAVPPVPRTTWMLIDRHGVRHRVESHAEHRG